MQSAMLLVQAMAYNVALCCGALFAGAAVYISLVEQPTILEGGRDTGVYLLFAQPRPAVFLISFATVGGVAGLAAGIAGGAPWWLAGGVALLVAAALQQGAVIPATRGLADGDVAALKRLARLHAVQSLAGLAALSLFITAI
jgi:hypothetical protein